MCRVRSDQNVCTRIVNLSQPDACRWQRQKTEEYTNFLGQLYQTTKGKKMKEFENLKALDVLEERKRRNRPKRRDMPFS